MQHGKPRHANTNLSDENTVLEFKPESELPTEPINEQLREHQISSADWENNNLVKELHIWAKRMILKFKLETSVPAIMIDRINRNRYGHYRYGRNGFGLRNEIAINQAFISERGFGKVLGTLLHELLHAEQEESGKPGKNNYHNKAFRTRAASFGLIVDQKGHTEYAPPPSPFRSLLSAHKIKIKAKPRTVSVAISLPPSIRPGQSKLKLWVCKCEPQPVRVRVAIKDFQAKCLKCGEKFRQGS